MKCESFNLSQVPADKGKLHKIFDFVGYYKSESEIEPILGEKRKSDDNHTKNRSKSIQETSKRERSPNKSKKKRKNEPVDVSHISIDGSNLNSSLGPSTSRKDPQTTSTPITRAIISASVSKVKSIMKSTVVNKDDSMDGTKTFICKPKKRNKSVSFMLDDNDEVVVKRIKSDDTLSKNKNVNDTKHNQFNKSDKDKKKYLKNLQNEHLLGKENKVDLNQNVAKKSEKIHKKKFECDTPSESVVSDQPESQGKKKGVKKFKQDRNEIKESIQINTKTDNPMEPKNKKIKKKKHQTKSETEAEPIHKLHKKEIKPDVIAEDLENLSIGDNAHTLSNLLDEMRVADKTKKIKSKSKHKEIKNVVETNSLLNEDEKEKVKWKKRKWNKDKKGLDSDSLATSVIVENLPISMMLTYKKMLAEHFAECGLIKNIGLAEMYPSVESTPVFTTTIHFYSDGAATQALEKDYMLLEGSHIRVKRPLPAADTTLVLRSYGELSDQFVCSLLSVCKIRSIRHVVKGRKGSSTAFVEMDGPESVKKALKIASGVKICGKKVHVNKYEVRSPKKAKTEEDKSDAKDSDELSE